MIFLIVSNISYVYLKYWILPQFSCDSGIPYINNPVNLFNSLVYALLRLCSKITSVQLILSIFSIYNYLMFYTTLIFQGFCTKINVIRGSFLNFRCWSYLIEFILATRYFLQLKKFEIDLWDTRDQSRILRKLPFGRCKLKRQK